MYLSLSEIFFAQKYKIKFNNRNKKVIFAK